MSTSTLVRHAQRPDSPEAVAERVRYGRAVDQARREMKHLFDPINITNAHHAIRWEIRRIRELVGSGSGTSGDAK